MNTYWVADSYESMNELELVYVFSSVKLWKRYHPSHKTILYTDEQSWKTIGWEGLWDEVRFFDFSTNITKGEHKFWAAGKLQAMKEFETPFSILDLDMIYNGEVQFDKPIISAHKEVGGDYRNIGKSEPFVKSNIKTFSKSPKALNVSFLHIRDKEFKNEYVNTSLEWMKLLSENGYATGGLMTFCEQKLLLDMIERDGISYRTLIEPQFLCSTNKWDKEFNENDNKYFHLKTSKKRAHRDETFMLVQRGNILKLLDNIDDNLVKESFEYLKSKR